MQRGVRQLAIGLVVAVMGTFVWAGVVSAEVVLCKSRWSSYVKAREGSCRRGETQIPIQNAAENTNAQTICDTGEILDGDGNCVDDPNACAANEVLLGSGGGCITITDLFALALGKTVFVTSKTVTGDLVAEAKAEFPTECGSVTLGLEAGDCYCQATADGAPLVPAGTYLAWLADDTGSPDSRFTKSPFPYRRLDLLPVANSYADLVSGSGLINNMNITELGAPSAIGSNLAKTGARPDGNPVSIDHCTNWTEGADHGDTGMVGEFTTTADPDWSSRIGSRACDDTAADHLICFGQ